jgi:hypothetical protein
VLDLGDAPLANHLPHPDDPTPVPHFPLAVVRCPACCAVQLTCSVPPEVLFSHYVYFSGVSDTVVHHSRSHAASLVQERALGPADLVVEAASNDGTLLLPFVEAGVPVLGIEPAANIAAAAQSRGVPTRTLFLGEQTGRMLAEEGLRASVFLANNVLAHVPDPVGFLAGARALLAEHGIVEVEVPWLVDLVDHVEFDTIYHEHLFYWSLTALDPLFRRAGLHIVDVHHLPIHGGSMRVRAAVSPGPRPRVEAWLAYEKERGVHEQAFYQEFACRVRELGRELVATLRALRSEGARIAAYGASAKGATLLHTFGIGPDLVEYVVDRSPAKSGRLTPGSRLPILPPEHLLSDRPDYALLLTWNHADEILAQQAVYRANGGKFVVPVPRVRIVA